MLTTIDVRATLKAKLGEDIEDYTILGACNTALAHQALSTAPEIVRPAGAGPAPLAVVAAAEDRRPGRREDRTIMRDTAMRGTAATSRSWIRIDRL
ncbi:MAG: DUF302 domain-containing protein [Pseudonocardia sp.]|nr:DUF302 domain-containing protein [Pseudonocardia sp.]